MTINLRSGTIGALMAFAMISTACVPLPPPPWRAHDRHDDRAERRDRWEHDHDHRGRDRHERMRWERR